MITHRYEHGIHAIDAEYMQPLFDAVRLIVDQGRAAFVDCGTAHSVPAMLAARATPSRREWTPIPVAAPAHVSRPT